MRQSLLIADPNLTATVKSAFFEMFEITTTYFRDIMKVVFCSLVINEVEEIKSY